MDYSLSNVDPANITDEVISVGDFEKLKTT